MLIHGFMDKGHSSAPSFSRSFMTVSPLKHYRIVTKWGGRIAVRIAVFFGESKTRKRSGLAIAYTGMDQLQHVKETVVYMVHSLQGLT